MDATLPAGTSVAGYRIESVLGSGGMGTVYLARAADGEVTALKLLDLGGEGGTELRAAFEREVALCRRLVHPCIVRLLGGGMSGDLAFVAMELMADGDLGQLRQRRGMPPPVRWVLEVGVCVARALAFAHQQGIVHRDVKPANILVDTRARLIKLSDFGLARVADLQRSRTGVLAGTPAYMAPEQLADGAADARGDLYSLGAVLFELLAGRPPHQAATLGALLREVGRAPPPDLLALRPDLPVPLSALVVRLLAKSPVQRPGSAKALADELAAIGAGLGSASTIPWP